MKNYILAFIILIALSACGGGGGGGGGGSSASSTTNWTSTKCTGSYANSDGIIVPCAYQTFNTTQNSTTGSYDSSTYNSDNYGVISGSTSSQYMYHSYSGTKYSFGGYVQAKSYGGSLSLAEDHLTDVTGLISSAWANGWTGTGTTINIIDDHQSNVVTSRMGTFTDLVFVGSYGASGTRCNYTASGDITSDMTHGAIVSAIAGGDKRSVSGFEFELQPSSASVNSGQSGCTGSSIFTNSSYNTAIQGTSTIEYVPGVAKNATIILSNVDLSSRQNPTNTAQVLEGHIQNSSSYTAVNLSLGYLSPGGTYDWDWYKANHASIFSMSSNPVGVYVIAAGNKGAACSAANFVDCNEIAAIAILNSILGDQSIVAGATRVESGVKTVASYSNRAGVMKDRFLLASGSCGYTNDATGNAVEGTSCAAPRIAGAAAILKSKFSNLTGANVADILLLTADKDINDDGYDDFSSTDANFGRGELDLSSALSPVGNLIP